MASGGYVDRIAAEFGVHFISFERRVKGRHQSKARRTCQKILEAQGAEHLRLVFALINTPKNRGNWSAPVFTAVSWLVRERPELVARRDFVGLFDEVDMEALQAAAKRTNPKAPTVTLSVLLSYEIDRLVEAAKESCEHQQQKDQAA
jgi:hypothetical protein